MPSAFNSLLSLFRFTVESLNPLLTECVCGSYQEWCGVAATAQ